MLKKSILLIVGMSAIAFVGWQAVSALQSTAAPAATEKSAPEPAKKATPKPRPGLGNSKTATPMAQRVAQIGVLNKRNSLSRDLTMKPGEAIRMGDLVVRLRACETTAPWEDEKLTGAFLQVLTRGSDEKWRKNFSGWVFKESPSLNVVEHPIYDVWVKDCKMSHPDIGEDTVITREDEPSSSSYKDIE